jgi:hypothetical protein
MKTPGTDFSVPGVFVRSYSINVIIKNLKINSQES